MSKQIQLTIILVIYTVLESFSQNSAFKRVTTATNPLVNYPNTPATYKGASWVDFDGDNWVDLFTNQYFVFKNLGNGNFERLADLPGVQLGQIASGSSWGDINNDGHVDGIITSATSGFYINNGNTTFTNLTGTINEVGGFPAWDCALVDADNNGFLDLTYVHAKGFHAVGPFPSLFYLQNSDGTFIKKTGFDFTDSLAAYTVPTWADYDLDGDMDLFIGSGPAQAPPGALPDYCFKNTLKETGTFNLERLTGFPFSNKQDGQVYNFIDFDNDGDLDICLTNYIQRPTQFYRNDPTGYTSINTPFTVAAQHLANTWGDFNHDGFIDLLISTDQQSGISYYRNKGDGSFANIKLAGITNGSPCGLSVADYDNDGDLDFYVTGASEARSLFRNDTIAGNRNWAQFSLVGIQSNKSAIGATIRVKANIGGQSMWQIRQVLAHNSFQGQNDLRQHFGLRDATTLDSIEISWPSGLKQIFSGLITNQIYKITEGNTPIIITQTYTEEEQDIVVVSPNPFQDYLNISTSIPISHVQPFDSSGRILPSHFQLISTNTVQLKLSAPKGVYFLLIRFENGKTLIKKVISQ